MAKNLFARYIWEVTTIYDAGRITLRELNRKWRDCYLYDDKDIPRKTFDNHRKEIEMIFDLNIVCDKRDNTYRIQDEQGFREGEVRRWLVNNFAVSNMLGEAGNLKDRILFEDIPSGQKYLTAIIRAMREGKVIGVTYQSYWREGPSSFRLKPYALKIFHQRWYLIAQNVAFDGIRIYALDRIGELELSEERFDFPNDFAAAEFFADSYGVIIGDDMEAEVVRLKVMNNQAKYFHSLPLHHSQKEIEANEDFSVFEYRLKPTYDFQQAILSHGRNVEVLTPAWLRESIVLTIKDMMRLYHGEG